MVVTPQESGGGPPQSKTLARWPVMPGWREAFSGAASAVLALWNGTGFVCWWPAAKTFDTNFTCRDGREHDGL